MKYEEVSEGWDNKLSEEQKTYNEGFEDGMKHSFKILFFTFTPFIIIYLLTR